MKTSSKLFCFVIAVFFMCLNTSLFGQEQIEKPVLVENNEGELFFIYHEDGLLTVKKSSDGGSVFEELYIDAPFEQVKDIVLFNQFYTTWKIFITAEYNGADNIFSYIFNDEGELVLEYGGPIGSHGTGAITDLRVTKGHLDRHVVSYLQEGDLHLIFLDPVTQDISQTIVNSQSEHISSYYIEYYFDENGLMVHQGYYISRTGSFFSSTAKGLAYFNIDGSDSVETAPVSDDVGSLENVTLLNTPAAGFMVQKGNKIFYYSQNGGVWEPLHEIELPFSSAEIQTISLADQFFHIVLGDGKGYADFDGTPEFNNPAELSSQPVKGEINLLKSEYGSTRGFSFMEDSVHVGINVTAFNMGAISPEDDIPVELTGDMTGCVFLENDSIYLASFIINNSLVYRVGGVNWQDQSFQWTDVDTGEWSGSIPEEGSKGAVFFSGKSNYSVYDFGTGLFVLNKDNPGESRFYTGASYIPFAVTDRPGVVLVSNEPEQNTLIFVDREVQ